jgi:hypothetical protein
LKKRTKKLLLCWAWGAMLPPPQAESHKVFLLLFVHKKKGLTLFLNISALASNVRVMAGRR